MASPTYGHGFEQTLEDGEGQGSQTSVVHGVTESRTVLSDYCCYNTFHGRQFFHEPRGKGGDDLGVTEVQ